MTATSTIAARRHRSHSGMEIATTIGAGLLYGGLTVVSGILIVDAIAIGGFVGWLLAAVYLGCALIFIGAFMSLFTGL